VTVNRAPDGLPIDLRDVRVFSGGDRRFQLIATRLPSVQRTYVWSEVDPAPDPYVENAASQTQSVGVRRLAAPFHDYMEPNRWDDVDTPSDRDPRTQSK
jgi:hypothetical protein